MAKRFYIEFDAKNDLADTRYIIEVWDADFVGTAEAIKIDTGNTLRWNADSEERHSAIRGSEISFNFLVDSADQKQFIYDIQSSREGRFSVELRRGIPDNRYWAGVILPDISSYQDREKTVYNVVATDGIAALRKIEYRPTDSTFYSGKVTFVEHILNCLNKLSYVTTHWTNTARFLRTATDWWEASMTRASANDAMNLSYVDHSNYYRFEKGQQKAMSCLDVLEDICKTFGCYIRQVDGTFRVEQVSYRQAGYITRNYDYQGNYIDFTSNTAINTVDNTTPGSGLVWKSYLNYDYYAGLKKVILNFETWQRRNYLVGAELDDTNTSFDASYPLYKATDGTVLRFRLPIQYRITNVAYPSGIYTPVFIRFQGTLRLVTSPVNDSKYWRRIGYIGQTTYQINYLTGPQGEWVSNLTTPNTFDVFGIVGGIPPVGISVTNVVLLDQDLPPMEEDATSIELTIDFLEIQDSDGTVLNPAWFTVEFVVTDPYLGTYTDGVATTTSDTNESQVNNDETEYTEVYEITTTVGTSTDLNTLGAIFIDNAGDFELAALWGNGTDPADTQITNLLGQAIMGGQLRPIKKANGTARGDFEVQQLFRWVSDSVSVDYLFHSGELSLDFNELNGLFYEVDYDDTFSVTPIRRKKKIIINPNGADIEVTSYPGGNSNNQPGFVSNIDIPAGTTHIPHGDSTTRYELTSGAVTSVDLLVAANAGQYWEDDVVTITNPLTGSFERLTVTATSAESDGVLAVTGTLVGNYPPGSPLSIARRTGRNNLPIGTANGDILYYDSTENRYLPITFGALAVLTLPSCVSDEDAVDNYGVAVGGWYLTAPGHFSVSPGMLKMVMAS